MKLSLDGNHNDRHRIPIFVDAVAKAWEKPLSVPRSPYIGWYCSHIVKKGRGVSFIGAILSLVLVTGFLVHLSPVSVAAQTSCPAKNVQHWDKIIFAIKSPQLAAQVKLPANTELDIKVRDDPTKVADLKLKVLQFLGVPTESRNSIDILEVRYAMICAM